MNRNSEHWEVKSFEERDRREFLGDTLEQEILSGLDFFNVNSISCLETLHETMKQVAA